MIIPWTFRGHSAAIPWKFPAILDRIPVFVPSSFFVRLQYSNMPPVIDEFTCSPCGICVEVCPEDVFGGSSADDVPTVAYPDECYHCSACVVDCPVDAITLYIPLPMRL